MKSSAMLLAFYKAWLAGSDRNFIRGDAFGLCGNLTDWAWANYPREGFGDLSKGLLNEMKKQFTDAGLNSLHPFNTSHFNYVEESNQNLCSTNPKRIQWVLDRINDMEE